MLIHKHAGKRRHECNHVKTLEGSIIQYRKKINVLVKFKKIKTTIIFASNEIALIKMGYVPFKIKVNRPSSI